MAAFIGAAAFAFLQIVLVAAPAAHDAQWTARTPERCATFEQRYAPANKEWCDRWESSHAK